MEAVKSISYRLINTSFPNSIQSAHILNSIPFIVAYIDKDFRFLYLNPPCERFLEVTTDTVTGKTIFEVFGKKIKEQMPAELNDSVICFEAEICLDTKSSFAEFTLNPELDEENEIKGYALFINDITAKKVKEKNLIEKTINLEDYLDNVKAPLHKVNSNGFIIWANNAELNLLGYTKEEYIGHHITEFHANPNAVSDILRRLSNNEELDRYETVLKCKDGSFRNVAISSNVHFEDGEFIYTRCFTLDITEQKKLFKNLYESEQHFRML